PRSIGPLSRSAPCGVSRTSRLLPPLARRGRGGDVAVRRIAAGVVRDDSVVIFRASLQACVAVAAGVGAERRDRRPIDAVQGALDLEAGLVARVVFPGQLDRSAGQSLCEQIARRGGRGLGGLGPGGVAGGGL